MFEYVPSLCSLSRCASSSALKPKLVILAHRRLRLTPAAQVGSLRVLRDNELVHRPDCLVSGLFTPLCPLAGRTQFAAQCERAIGLTVI